MKGINANTAIPLAARQALSVLGNDLKTARVLQRHTMQDMATRLFVTRNTITRMERGDPSVSMGTYATALFVLGFVSRLRGCASPEDGFGAEQLRQHLPKRVRNSGGSGDGK